jgi:hypothetical protein
VERNHSPVNLLGRPWPWTWAKETGPGLGKAPNASSRYNGAVGVATLPASLIFGTLYQVFGALAAFGWGAALALCAVILLTGVKGQGTQPAQ